MKIYTRILDRLVDQFEIVYVFNARHMPHRFNEIISTEITVLQIFRFRHMNQSFTIDAHSSYTLHTSIVVRHLLVWRGVDNISLNKSKRDNLQRISQTNDDTTNDMTNLKYYRHSVCVSFDCKNNEVRFRISRRRT